MLVVTHAPLTPDHGAAQLALNLGKALRGLGQEVTVWSPHPLSAKRGWSAGLRAMREKLEGFVAAEPRFDIIDAPASLITARIGRQPLIVVRSVQPDLRYLFDELVDGLPLTTIGLLHSLNRAVQNLYQGVLVLQGWKRAGAIVCQGELEYRWMMRFLPMWKAKMRSYVTALSDEDQANLKVVRSERIANSSEKEIRFLWIGRWARHKGNLELLKFARQWFSERPQDRLTIAGCGPITLSSGDRELMASGRIRVVPSYARESLPALLKEHDVGLFTSKVEGWGLALNEMLESGMTVFATPAGGVQDLKPYFATRLRTFPPLIAEVQDTRIGNPDWERYYGDFNWHEIARKYLTSVLSAKRF